MIADHLDLCPFIRGIFRLFSCVESNGVVGCQAVVSKVFETQAEPNEVAGRSEKERRRMQSIALLLVFLLGSVSEIAGKLYSSLGWAQEHLYSCTLANTRQNPLRFLDCLSTNLIWFSMFQYRLCHVTYIITKSRMEY